MLYSGHFSFDETGENNNERHGYFTCIVNADTPEMALRKFRKRIVYIKNEMKEPLFETIQCIYVEDIVEISDTPDDAIVTRFQSSEGPFPRSKSCSLPTSDTVKIKAYQWVREADDPRELPDMNEEYKEAVPFLQFS
ncbi:MAG: hypothetical protein D3926_05110 [Desulfobacteraceae bacterium]|nr:MAG: hypothetical protein D3926_05110 [Desulfobacteraceae bacterium]